MRYVVAAGAVVLPIAAFAFATDASTATRLVALALVLVPGGVFLLARYPFFYYGALALTLAIVPFAPIPGTPLSWALALGLLAGVAAILNPPARAGRAGPLEWALLALVVTSTLSMVFTIAGNYDVPAWGRWLVATGIAPAVLRLDPARRALFGRLFAWGTGVAAAIGIVLLVADRTGRILNSLTFVGYGADQNLRVVVSSAGNTIRLTGTYVDPNAGGLFLFAGLFLCIALVRGWQRVFLGLLIGAALVLTLSRASIFGVLAAFAVYFVLHSIRFGSRLRILGLGLLVVVVGLAVPGVAGRIFGSFGTEDAGSTARGDALRDFPNLMTGHWLFGLGWGRIEFRDGAAAQAVNYVANAPLLSVYRGGLLTGIAFTVMLLVGVVLSFRALRSRSGPAAGNWPIMGAAFIGLAFVTLQLDFPVVTIAAVTAVFSVLIGFVPGGRPAGRAETSAPRDLALAEVSR